MSKLWREATGTRMWGAIGKTHTLDPRVARAFLRRRQVGELSAPLLLLLPLNLLFHRVSEG